MLGAQFVLPNGICVLSGLVWDKHITALAIWRFKKHPFSLAERFAFVVQLLSHFELDLTFLRCGARLEMPMHPTGLGDDQYGV